MKKTFSTNILKHLLQQLYGPESVVATKSKIVTMLRLYSLLKSKSNRPLGVMRPSKGTINV